MNMNTHAHTLHSPVSTGTGSGFEDGVSVEVASVDGLVGVVAVLSVAGGLVVGTEGRSKLYTQNYNGSVRNVYIPGEH